MKTAMIGLALLWAGSAATPVLAQAGTAASSARPAAANPVANNYSDPAAWLCRPGRRDACSQDQTATVVRENGTTSIERYTPALNPLVDCFYVYPTVSTDPTPNSDMHADIAEMRVIEQQFARFGGVCRQYAPLYRQVTLTALRANMLKVGSMPANRELAYDDVRDAWRYYLAHDNRGRGFVLIGHSQGSGILTRLIKEEIDAKPAQRQLISALLAGTRLPIPGRSASPMAFRSVPLCRSATQLGCAVAFASFRIDSPPPPNSRFGKVEGSGEPAACVNPAALGGGEGQLDAYLASRVAIADSAIPPKPWVKSGPPVTTPFVKVPGLLSARCLEQNGFGYLAVTTHGDAAGRRVDEITGDVVSRGVTLKDWGLHLIDMNLTMGNLISLVRDESAAYLARR